MAKSRETDLVAHAIVANHCMLTFEDTRAAFLRAIEFAEELFKEDDEESDSTEQDEG